MATTIEQTARRLRIAVVMVMTLMVVAYASARLNLGFGPAHVEVHSLDLNSGAAHFIAIAAIILLLAALVRLTQMLGLIAGGALFSQAVVGRFRAFAFWLLLSALWTLFGPSVARLLFPQGGPGHHLRMVLDFREIIMVGITLLLFLLARLLEKAREIETEMREIV
ncbi:MAG: DUF2975 domain-containing protein [Sphingomicrobium sp.]